jgi:hypothetical protein
MPVQQIGCNDDDGAVFGSSASELIGFHGKTPCDQAAFIATTSIAAISVSGVVGFSSSGAFSNAITLLNGIQALLVEKGLMAAS